MHKLYNLLLPLEASKNIILSIEDIEILEENDWLSGEEYFALEYELKTGRSLLVDMMISAILWALIVSIIILSVFLIM